MVDDGPERMPVALNIIPVAPAVAAVVDEGGKRLYRLIATIEFGRSIRPPKVPSKAPTDIWDPFCERLAQKCERFLKKLESRTQKLKNSIFRHARTGDSPEMKTFQSANVKVSA